MSNEQNREPMEETGREETADSGESAGGAVDFAQLTPELKVASLTERLEAAEAEAKNSRNEVQYKEAELQTVRRRAAEERISAVNSAKASMVRSMLPALEALGLAVMYASDDDPIGQGVKMVGRQFADALKSEGVTAIEADVGAEFNPLEHEAQGTEETSEYPSGHITKIIQPGYKLQDRVIRPAQVIVARDPQS